jgi:hypothetical protein
MLLGRVLYASDFAFTVPWSIAETVFSLARPEELPPDAGHVHVARDIAERGFYVELPEAPLLRGAGETGTRPRMVVTDNPYRYVVARKRPGRHRAVGRLVPARDTARARRLIVVFHCYGIPSPWAMSKLFGLDDVPDTDVVYAIMHQHQRGTYSLWPGAGFASASPSCMVENLRAAITGARTLVRGLRAARRYEHVSVHGYSIGGQLALHLANSEALDRVTLYCPVVSAKDIRSELGLMRFLYPLGERLARARDPGYSGDLLDMTHPLRYSLRLAEENVEVIVQRNDAMTTPAHVDAIRRKYPGVGWHEFGGTHLIPLGRERFRAIVRASPAS